MAILKNDHQLLSLGFAPVESKYYQQLKDKKRREDSPQLSLI